MQVQTPSPDVSAPYQPIPREHWQAYFDHVTKALGGRKVEIEVLGLDLGDQIEVEWLPLNGLTYEPDSDTFYVFLDLDEGDLDHAISHPQEIFVHGGTEGLERVVIKDADDHQHIIRLRAPVMIPANVG